MDKLVIAHRGASGLARENTLEAFEAAIKAGADMIELDVRRTKDGVLAVHHDPAAGGKNIAGTDWRELKKAAPYIPGLGEVIALAKGKIRLDVEIKESGYEKQAADLLLSGLSPEDFIVSSFRADVVKKIKKNYPELTVGLILPSWKNLFADRPGLRGLSLGGLFLIWDYFTTGKKLISQMDFLAVSRFLPDGGIRSKEKYAGKPLYVWTVDSEKDLEYFLSQPWVAGVISDFPAVAVKIKKRVENIL